MNKIISKDEVTSIFKDGMSDNGRWLHGGWYARNASKCN